MPQEHIVPVESADARAARRLDHIEDGQERKAYRERLRNAWSLLLSNVTRTAPRLRSEDVTGLIAPDGRPTQVPPWDLPLDVVWGTDRPDNGRAFVIFAVEDPHTQEKAVVVVFEQRGPTNLPIGVARLVGTLALVGDPPVADTEDTIRGLLRLYRDGQAAFSRLVGADAASATLEVTEVALQFTKQGFAPMRARAKHSDARETQT